MIELGSPLPVSTQLWLTKDPGHDRALFLLAASGGVRLIDRWLDAFSGPIAAGKAWAVDPFAMAWRQAFRPGTPPLGGNAQGVEGRLTHRLCRLPDGLSVWKDKPATLEVWGSRG